MKSSPSNCAAVTFQGQPSWNTGGLKYFLFVSKVSLLGQDYRANWLDLGWGDHVELYVVIFDETVAFKWITMCTWSKLEQIQCKEDLRHSKESLSMQKNRLSESVAEFSFLMWKTAGQEHLRFQS